MLNTYLEIPLAIARVKERCGLAADNVSQDQTIADLLEESAGATSIVPVVYRPYYVAARILEQDIQRQQLKKAGSAEFTGLTTVIASLFNQQAAIDASLALAVPPGMEAPGAVESLNVKNLWGSASIHTSVLF